MPLLLSCTDLAKSYDAHALFDGLSLGIESGRRVGLIGANGAGKSTLLRILVGLEQPDGGSVALAQGTRLGWLPQRDELPADQTPVAVIEAALALSHPHDDDHRREAQARVMLGKAGFTGEEGAPGPESLVGTLSGGWRKRVAIARALAQEPELLLMDEPTNHLDVEGIWWLEDLIAAAPFTVLVASHDRFFLERVCDRVIEIGKQYPGGWFGSEGGYSTFLEKRAELMANQRRQQDALDNQVRREIAWLRANPSAQTCKSKARVDRAFGKIDDLAELKFRNSQDRRVDAGFLATGRRGNELVTLDGVAKERGGRPLFADVSLTLAPGTRLGVLGLNGSGKTTFLNVLAKRLAADAGTVRHAATLKVEVFDQQRERLDPKQTLRRALSPTGDTVVVRGRGMHVAGWARRFLFSPAQLDLAVGKLSGGEQARVLIADLMRRECDLLILDEPTNDLDIPSLEVLEAGLVEFPGAVVLVTHDRYLLDRVSTTLLALDGRGSAWKVADCSQWEALAARLTSDRERPTAPPAAKPVAAARNRPGLSGKERREMDAIGERIAAGEAKTAQLEAQIADPAVTGDAQRLAAACAELATAQAEVAVLYARWETLEAKAG